MPSNLFDRPPILDNSGTLLSDWKYVAETADVLLKNGKAENETTTIYTVPAGKVAYIISVQLAYHTSAAISDKDAEIYVDTGSTILLAQQVNTAAASEGQAWSANFAIPLRLDAAQAVIVSSGSAGLETIGTMQGYEVDAK
jgi:hypothetical protein